MKKRVLGTTQTDSESARAVDPDKPSPDGDDGTRAKTVTGKVKLPRACRRGSRKAIVAGGKRR